MPASAGMTEREGAAQTAAHGATAYAARQPSFASFRRTLRGESRSRAGALPRPDYWYAKNRSGSIAEKEKRPRGRPRTGRDPAVTVRIPVQIGVAITAWIDRQPDPKPSRSEAIRRLIEKGLED